MLIYIINSGYYSYIKRIPNLLLEMAIHLIISSGHAVLGLQLLGYAVLKHMHLLAFSLNGHTLYNSYITWEVGIPGAVTFIRLPQCATLTYLPGSLQSSHRERLPSVREVCTRTSLHTGREHHVLKRVGGRHLQSHRSLLVAFPDPFRNRVWKRELDPHQSSTRAIKRFHSAPVICNQRLQNCTIHSSKRLASRLS